MEKFCSEFNKLEYERCGWYFDESDKHEKWKIMICTEFSKFKVKITLAGESRTKNASKSIIEVKITLVSEF